MQARKCKYQKKGFYLENRKRRKEKEGKIDSLFGFERKRQENSKFKY